MLLVVKEIWLYTATKLRWMEYALHDHQPGMVHYTAYSKWNQKVRTTEIRTSHRESLVIAIAIGFRNWTSYRANSLCSTLATFASSPFSSLIPPRNDAEVLKSPLRYNLSRCSESTVILIKEEESFSSACIEREKFIYQSLPKHKDILECLGITEAGVRFPYIQNGHLRDYIRKNSSCLDSQTKNTWIWSAVHATEFVHRHSIVHGDISARNFLVADDLSIKLCDFAGSGIDNMPSFVTEEDRYRKSPDSPRTFQTDLFALGCLIFEIVVGSRPYEEIADKHWETIAEN